jgi:predicted phosphodiesterase
VTRVAVLSDIHGNLPALQAVTLDAEARGCADFINLGDLLSGPLWPAETADWLIARDWRTIAGNHERQLLSVPPDRMGPSDAFAHAQLTPAHLAWIAALPAVDAAAGLFLCHGTPASDIEHLLETIKPDGLRPASDREVADRLGNRSEALTLCGHSHLPRLRRLPDGRSVANPGSVGLQAFHDDRPYPYVVEVGDPRARYAIVEHGDVTFHAVDYDHRAAAAKAQREGRGDWAHALATGQVAR